MLELYERLGKVRQRSHRRSPPAHTAQAEEAKRIREAHHAAFPRQRLDRHRPNEPEEPADMAHTFEREI